MSERVKIMNRLVRDRIGEVPWRPETEAAKSFLRPVNSDYEHLDLLKAKLLEEAGEVIFAQGPMQVAEEIGDLLSVVEAIAALHGVRMADVMSAKSAKERERGGFLQGMVLTL